MTGRPPKRRPNSRPRVDLTDESGQDFDLAVGSLTHSTDDAGSRAQLKPNVAIFKPAEGLEPGEGQRFRLKVALKEEPVFAPGWEGEIEAPPGGWSNVGPVAFDFEVPVRPVPVVEVGQKETVEGVTMTLKRVFNSPGRPQAVVCFESPDDDHSWSPITAQRDVLQTDPPLPADPLGNGCWSLTLEAPMEGDSTIEVTDLYGVPLRAEDNLERRIRGPWTFEVSAPETGG